MLTQRMRQLPSDTILWISASGEPTTVQDAAHWPEGKRYRGKSVALWFSDSNQLARAILALDGSAARFLLLAPGTSSETGSQLISQFGAEVILTDADTESLTADPEANIPTAWVIPTSGTTGNPKLVVHTFGSLTKTVKSNAEVGRQFRWGQLYDLARFAGLQVFLNSILSGSTLVFTRASDPLGERVSHLARHGCNALSATPTLWRKILMMPESCELNPRQITLGGEIVDQPILNALRAQYPEARISHIYASTEAGAAFTVNDGTAGFPRRLLDSPPAGLELKVDADGFLLIRPTVREQSYLDGGTRLFDDEGFVNTGDLVRTTEDRVFFLGRANGTINVGGNKVPPEEVESFLHTIPGVRVARVYGKQSSITGTLVAADIQAETGVTELDALRRVIASRCAQSLPGYKVPAMIRFVSDIQTNGTGKVVRR
ncbi:MAG TPA: fatty acid--CoA ligase family protein [Bryobacteraceae bacterium]|nr:fatty acid--CoA ligase family protein [Bryobacteraceae bacterium]